MDRDARALRVAKAIEGVISTRTFESPTQRVAAIQVAVADALDAFENPPPKRKYPLGLVRRCPNCTSGDVDFCAISVRPYCRECNYWGAVNFGTERDAVVAWSDSLKRRELCEE